MVGLLLDQWLRRDLATHDAGVLRIALRQIVIAVQYVVTDLVGDGEVVTALVLLHRSVHSNHILIEDDATEVAWVLK